ncbi:MAG: hypothetical protein QOF25_3924 [Mycobacterium sp.]|jgi:hypothetical protein|nr:hypothetical protein [Mycobacterium sp.]
MNVAKEATTAAIAAKLRVSTIVETSIERSEAVNLPAIRVRAHIGPRDIGCFPMKWA